MPARSVPTGNWLKTVSIVFPRRHSRGLFLFGARHSGGNSLPRCAKPPHAQADGLPNCKTTHHAPDHHATSQGSRLPEGNLSAVLKAVTDTAA